jgi:hypothetical protein
MDLHPLVVKGPVENHLAVFSACVLMNTCLYISIHVFTHYEKSA